MGDLRRALGRMRRARSVAASEARLVWIMGSPRSGSTWLANLLAADERVVKVDEPLIAAHLGVRTDALRVATDSSFDDPLLYDEHAGRPDYVFSQRYRGTWTPDLRSLLLHRFAAQVRIDAPGIEEPFVVIKEPHGSEAAPLLFEVLPSAKLIFLLRDARDVVDSVLDMALTASGDSGDEARRHAILAEAARAWDKRMRAVQSAYEALPDAQRLMLRYEDMRADPVSDVLRVYRWLHLDVDEAQVRGVAERFAFEKVPPQSRGSGQFHRAASPGLWQQNLSEAEQELVHAIAGDSLRAFGYDVAR